MKTNKNLYRQATLASDGNSSDGQSSEENNSEERRPESIWVFGYGSLCWKPGFEYETKVVGYIEGFARRFWQGNVTHRGKPNQPGRVATLVKDTSSRTYGIAFKLRGRSALDYLEHREINQGGYETHVVPFSPRRQQDQEDEMKMEKIDSVLIYVASPLNEHWLGPAHLHEIAEQVVQSRGICGSNAEYVLKLAHWFRFALPDVSDDHLFSLETLIRQKTRRISTTTFQNDS